MIVVLCVLACIFVPVCQGCSFWVSEKGDDLNNGTSHAEAWKTLSRAVGACREKDKVCVEQESTGSSFSCDELRSFMGLNRTLPEKTRRNGMMYECDKWVSLSGSDDNDGSESQPWKSLKFAALEMDRGTVCLDIGVFKGSPYCDVGSFQNQSPIPFKSVIGRGSSQTIIDCESESGFLHFNIPDEDTYFFGFEVRNAVSETGAIFLPMVYTKNFGHTALFVDVLFSDNVSTNPNYGVVTVGQVPLVRNCTFLRNSSQKGAFFVWLIGNAQDSSRTWIFESCIFDNSPVVLHSTAEPADDTHYIFFNRTSHKNCVNQYALDFMAQGLTMRNISIVEGTFFNNSAGSLRIDASYCKVANSTFEGVGSLEQACSQIQIEKSVFRNVSSFSANMSFVSCYRSKSSWVLSDVELHELSGSRSFIHVQIGDTMTIQKSNFTHALPGILVALTGSEVSILDSNFAENQGSIFGGGVLIRNCSFFGHSSSSVVVYGQGAGLISWSNFSNNQNTVSPGGAIFVGVGGSVNISNCLFVGNSGVSGGSVASEDAILIIENSTFESSTASSGGGALFVATSSSGLLVLNHVVFRNNSANSGGAIFCNNTNVTVVESSFSENHASYGSDIACAGGSCVWPVDLHANISCGLPRDIIFVQGPNNCSDVGVCGVGYACCTIGRALQIVLPGFTIAVRTGLYETEKLPLQIATKNITMVSFDGIGKAVIDCGQGSCFKFGNLGLDGVLIGLSLTGGSQAINFTAQASPILISVVFANGSAFEISGQASPSFQNCSFLGSSGVISSGGLPLFENCHWEKASSLMITEAKDCKFRSCSFNQASETSIQAENSTIFFENCIFSGNQGSSGGVIAITSGSNVTIESCVFRSNIAFADGGALFISGASVFAVNSTFSDNLAHSGGAVLLNNASLMIRNCSFVNNSASGEGASSASGSGGAITILYSSSITILDCLFTQNLASSNGGAIYCTNSSISSSASVLWHNSASSQGGALYASLCSVSCQQALIALNIASFGGAVYGDRSTVSVEYSNVTLNAGFKNGAQFGSAVYLTTNSSFVLNGSSLSFHRAEIDRAPIVCLFSDLTIWNSSLDSNLGKEGGVIWALSSSIQVINCNASKNYAVGNGGVIFAEQTALEVRGGFMHNNYASIDGGCVFASNAVGSFGFNTKFENVTFTNNTAGNFGGALRVYNYAHAILVSCFFTSNSALFGGSVHCSIDAGSRSSFMNISNCVFMSNGATGGNGGAICGQGYGKKFRLYVNDSQFDDCYASVDGGMIWYSGTISIANSTFTNGKAQFGGSLAVSDGFVDLFNSSWNKNLALRYGGALYIKNSSLSMNQVHLSKNSAIYGAAVYLRETLFATYVGDCMFINNSALVAGGGYFCSNATLPLVSSSGFLANLALGYGNDNATQPMSLSVILPGDFSDSHIAMFPPSTIVSFEAALVDAYGQFVNDTTYQISINSPSELVIQGSVPHNQQPARGSVSFNVSFSGGTLFELYNCSISAASFEFPFSIGLTRCGFGKINQPGEGCGLCNVKEFSFDSVECVACPLVGPFPCASAQRSNTYVVEEGFYVLPSLDNPIVLVACPRQNETASRCLPITCSRPNCTNSSCLTTCDQSGSLCTSGYTGARCTQCQCDPSKNDTEEACYFRGFSDDCLECQRTPESLAFLIIGTVIGVALFVCVVVFEQSNPVLLVIELVSAVALILLGVQGQWFVEIMFMVLALTILATTPSVHNGAIKILLFYVQVTNVLVRNRLWPGWFEKIAQKINIANIQISGLQCINRAVFTNEAAAFALQMVFPWILILCVALIIVLRHLIAPCVRRQCPKARLDSDAEGLLEHDAKSEDAAHLLLENNENHQSVERLGHVRADASPGGTRELLIKTVIFVLYVGYFELTNQILAVFNCVHWELPDLTESIRSTLGQTLSQTYMDEKPWIMCDLSDPVYRALFAQALLFTAVYVVGIPLLYAVLLWRNRERIRQGEHIPWLAFLFEDYKTPVFWFELLWMGRRVLISLFVVVINGSDPFQPFFIVLILSTSLAVELHLHPFKDRIENGLEALVLITLLISYGGSYGSEHNGSFAAFQWFVAVLNVGVLCVLVLAVLWPFIMKIREKFRNCQCKCRRRRKNVAKELLPVDADEK